MIRRAPAAKGNAVICGALAVNNQRAVVSKRHSMGEPDLVKDRIWQWLSRNHQRIQRQQVSLRLLKLGAVALHRINDESGAKGAARGHDFPRAIVKNLCALGDVDTALLGRPGKPAHQFCRVYARTCRVKDRTESVRGAQGVLWFSPLELVNPHEC